MFKNKQELQDFILWAKAQKIRRMKVGDIEVEISDYAFIEDLTTPISQVPTPSEPQSEDEILRLKNEEEALLLYSAQ